MRGMTVIVEFSLPVLYVNFIFMSKLKEYSRNCRLRRRFPCPLGVGGVQSGCDRQTL